MRSRLAALAAALTLLVGCGPASPDGADKTTTAGTATSAAPKVPVGTAVPVDGNGWHAVVTVTNPRMLPAPPAGTDGRVTAVGITITAITGTLQFSGDDFVLVATGGRYLPVQAEQVPGAPLGTGLVEAPTTIAGTVAWPYSGSLVGARVEWAGAAVWLL